MICSSHLPVCMALTCVLIKCVDVAGFDSLATIDGMCFSTACKLDFPLTEMETA